MANFFALSFFRSILLPAVCMCVCVTISRFCPQAMSLALTLSTRSNFPDDEHTHFQLVSYIVFTLASEKYLLYAYWASQTCLVRWFSLVWAMCVCMYECWTGRLPFLSFPQTPDGGRSSWNWEDIRLSIAAAVLCVRISVFGLLVFGPPMALKPTYKTSTTDELFSLSLSLSFACSPPESVREFAQHSTSQTMGQVLSFLLLPMARFCSFFLSLNQNQMRPILCIFLNSLSLPLPLSFFSFSLLMVRSKDFLFLSLSLPSSLFLSLSLTRPLLEYTQQTGRQPKH